MCKINYEDISSQSMSVLRYCLRTSECFSVITWIKKKKGMVYAHEKALTILEPFLIQQKVGVKSWPGTITKGTNYVMNLYDTRKYRKSGIDLPNFFEPNETGQPEDICFYRDGMVWLATVSHERIAFADHLTKADRMFFKCLNIRVQ